MATDLKKLKEATINGATIRLVQRGPTFTGAIFRDGKRVKTIDADSADHVWTQLHDEVGRTDPRYAGFDGARTRFLHFFPNGFRSPGFDNSERAYKLRARDKLARTAPLDKAAAGKGFGEAILSVYRDTNLISPFEKTWVGEVLRGPDADAFIQAAARFTLEGGKTHLLSMKKVLGRAAKWTIVTYLPFFWRPDAHMFLKPEVTRDFAARVGHRFDNDYEAALNLPVYESLLDLTKRTELEIADLKPRDRIDVQSFIWVAGSYREGEEAPAL